MGTFFEFLGKLSLKATLIVLAVGFFLHAQSKPSAPALQNIDALTADNVKAFLTQVDHLTGGDQTITAHDISAFMLKHIDESALFKSSAVYTLPDGEEKQDQIEMDKLAYIENTIKEQQSLTTKEIAMNIEYIHIDDNKKSAQVVTTVRKRGTLPLEDDFGDIVEVPLIGLTYCEQSLQLNDEAVIQMTDTNCSARMSLDTSL